MKKALIAILITALLFSFVGCKPSSDGNANADPLAHGEVHTDFPGVEIRIAQVYTEEGKNKLKVIWSNNTDYEVMYGEPYAIQRLDGNEWVSCSKDEMTAFTTVGYALKAGKEISKTYSISDLFDVSQPGTYRFKSNCSVSVNGKGWQDCALWADFTLGNVKCPDDSKETMTEVEWAAQYIRTNGYQDGAKFPRVEIIKNAKELNEYYTANNQTFDLERKDKVYSDTTIGFLDACDQYDEAFFEENYLIFVLLEEGSGSVRHEVRSVGQTSDKKISVSIDSILPDGAGTSDMAEWHIILELSRNVFVETPSDVLVYWGDVLRWNGNVVEPPKPEPAFKTPPAGTLHTPEGDVTLTAAGYDWTVLNSDGTATTTIADQASRPLPKDSLEPVIIESKYAETVYAYVKPGKYEATDSLGYFVKLNWEVDPTSVTYACWPDTVWQDDSTREESVVFHDDSAFYAKNGGYIYEFAVTWDDTGAGYHGTANYYVYIVGGAEHNHQVAEEAQTVDDPVTGYCGNTQTTLYIGDKEYSFMYGHSVTLTDILVNLNYDPMRVCRCRPEYTVDTEFGTGYGINLTAGYARCDKGQADLTQEQIDTIAEIIEWAETTNCKYPIDN